MIDREKLEKELNAYFDSIHFNKQEQEKCKALLKTRHGLLEGQASGVLKGMDDLSMLPDEKLFWFAELNPQIKLEKYFSNTEIENYKASKQRNETNETYPVVFHNFRWVSSDQWVGTVNIDFLYKLYNSSVIAYNLNTQRNPKIISQKDGREFYKISVNNHSVKQIYDLFQRGLFIPNDLTLNYIPTAQNNFEWVEQENETVDLILKKGTLDIIDGFHRYKAAIMYKQQNPQWDFTFVLNIMNFDEDKAKRYIAQQNKKNKISSSYAKTLDNTRYENLAITRLNEDPSSYYYGQIKALGNFKIDSGTAISSLGSLFSIPDMPSAIKIEKRICKILNATADQNPNLLNGISNFQLRVIFCCMKQFEQESDESIASSISDAFHWLERKGITEGSLITVKRQIADFAKERK